jgi:hypothetical protein
MRAVLKPAAIFLAQLVSCCLALYLYLWFSFGWWHCTGSDAAADRVREMDQRMLARLYANTQTFLSTRRSTSLLDDIDGDALPSDFSRLHARSASVYGDDMVFVLSGCYDDKVYLEIRRDAEDDSGEILLAPGEAQAKEVLWRSVVGDRSSR